MVIIQFFIYIFLSTIPLISYAAVDHEIAQSLKCSKTFSYFERKYQIPLDTLHSIALQESGKGHSQHKIKIVWPWTVNVEGKGYFFNSKQEAVFFVSQKIAQGKRNIDVGCMQINLKHHPDAFVSLHHAFDPKSNVAYSAKFLRTKYDQLGSWHKAISHYHSATDSLGSKYKQSVMKNALNMAEYKSSLRKYASDNNIYSSNASKNLHRTSYRKYYTISYPPPTSVNRNRNKIISKNKNSLMKIREVNNPSYHIKYKRRDKNLMVNIPSYQTSGYRRGRYN